MRAASLSLSQEKEKSNSPAPHRIGPIAHFHTNSKYYSALKPRANKVVDERLPHVTIQMPVYKESLEQARFFFGFF